MTRSELARLLRGKNAVGDSGPRLISEADPLKFMAAFADAVAGEGEVFLCDPNWGENERAQVTSLLELERGRPRPRGPGGEVAAVPSSDRGWLMIPTGGSSGKIKFARHDQDTIAAAVEGFTKHFSLTRVNAMGVLPLHHVSGLMAWLRCVLTGGRYVPLDWKVLEQGTGRDLPAGDGPLVISLVPTQLERLVRQPAVVEWLKRFQAIFIGGGPAWPALLEKAAALGLPLSLGYGMTETAAMVTALRPAEFLAGARDSGVALAHARVGINAQEAIVIGGGSLFRGYYPDWRDEGNFETADAGQTDDQGHLWVFGRRDGVIITGGEKVNPAEVESVLMDTGQFSAVVVLGVPDSEWGHVVVAAHPAADRPDWRTMEQAIGARLAAYKRPKRFVALTDWPRTSAIKVNRAEVLKRVCRIEAGA